MNQVTSHAIGATTTPLIEETIGSHFQAVARKFPDRDALVSRHQAIRYSYAQLDRESDRLASALLASGLEPGDRAGIWAHNCAEWLLMQIATAKVGIVLVNINPAYRVSELEYALNKVGCKVLVTMTAFKTSNYLAIVRDLAPELAGWVPGKLRAARAPDLRTVVHLGADEVPGMLKFADLVDRGRIDHPENRPDRDRRRHQVVLQGADRALQGSAPYQVRQRIPDDDHREDPEFVMRDLMKRELSLKEEKTA